jgi:hypothetical protein
MLSAKILDIIAMLTYENNLTDADYRVKPGVRGLCAMVFLGLLLLATGACSTNPTDLSTLAPSETLIFLESNDLGSALGAVTGSSQFRSAVELPPDFSSIAGLRIGVFVTGFDVGEDSVSDESAELRLRPRFVAVAESPSWFWNPNSFVDGPLANFVATSYGKDFKTESFDERDGEVRVWTSGDGRSSFVAVRDALVLFSNDRDALIAVLATRQGERNNLSGNSALRRLRREGSLAIGYIPQAGVAQLSNFVGISAALSTTDDEDGRSFIARIVPDLIRANVKEVLWSAKASDAGLSDRYEVVLSESVAEQMSVAAQTVTRESAELTSLIPSSAQTVTRYELGSPSVAWYALLENLSLSTDVLNGTLLSRAADGLLAPYGVILAGSLIDGVTSPVFTFALDDSGEDVVALLKVRDIEMVRSVVAIDFMKSAEAVDGFSLWASDDDEFGYAQKGDVVVLGDLDSVRRVLASSRSGELLAKSPEFARFAKAKGASVSLGRDSESIEQVAKALSLKMKTGNVAVSSYIVSTEFTPRGVIRSTSSACGLLGSIISQFSAG